MGKPIHTGQLASEAMLRLARMPRPKRIAMLRNMGRDRVHRLVYSRQFALRASQVWLPSEHKWSIYLAGRGWGKSRTGSETVRYVAEHPELCGGRESSGPDDVRAGDGGVIAIAGRTANDVNQTMLYGQSGIMTVSPPWFRPVHRKQDKILVWPNGVIARLMSGDVPDSFRGPNFGFAWLDEMPHWRRLVESWQNLDLALRVGKFPRGVITTTPLGVQTLIELVYECDDAGFPIPDLNSPDGFKLNERSRIIRGSSYDNRLNLSDDFTQNTVRLYEGTAAGKQEIHGEILMGIPNAIWQQDWFVRLPAPTCMLRRVAVVLDPAGTANNKSAETGMVVAGHGEDGLVYLLEDGSGRMTPEQWGNRAVDLALKWGADTIVAEDNFGADMVTHVLTSIGRTKGLRIKPVRAHRSKAGRANLVAGDWEGGRVIHCGDVRTSWRELERQMVQFDQSKNVKDQLCDRMDAAVWAVIFFRGGGDDLAKLRALGSPEYWRKVKQAQADKAKAPAKEVAEKMKSKMARLRRRK